MKTECSNCKAAITPGNLNFEFGDTTDESVEVRFACPACAQGYYTFAPIDDFIEDDSAPGKAVPK